MGGWANRLRLSLERMQKDSKYRVFIMGINGDTSRDVRERFENEYKTRKRKDGKNVLIFAIGINDSRTESNIEKLSIDEYKDNIKYLINEAKKHTNKIMFIGLTNVDESLTSPLLGEDAYYSNKRILKFDNELEKICLENNIRYVKTYGLLKENELYDGLHPDSSGHKKLFDLIGKNLFELLDK